MIKTNPKKERTCDACNKKDIAYLMVMTPYPNCFCLKCAKVIMNGTAQERKKWLTKFYGVKRAEHSKTCLICKMWKRHGRVV